MFLNGIKVDSHNILRQIIPTIYGSASKRIVQQFVGKYLLFYFQADCALWYGTDSIERQQKTLQYPIQLNH